MRIINQTIFIVSLSPPNAICLRLDTRNVTNRICVVIGLAETIALSWLLPKVCGCPMTEVSLGRAAVN